MDAEQAIVDYIMDSDFDDFSGPAVATVRNMLRADIGAMIAGACADGCRELVRHCREQGGRPEATLLVHGGQVPAASAAMANAVMSRALDFCDAIAPGPHIGSSTIPVALACVELTGGCTGREFVTALAIGAEVAARFNLTEAAYDGFDPTGICVPFGATAVAARLLKLDRHQTRNALGIVFNRCGGSFQSHIDGSLSVRLNQGWVALDAVGSARLAQSGFTGPRNFLRGIYGYLHLYGKGLLDVEHIVGDLGRSERLMQIIYKKYPSCAMTQAPTDVIISMLREYRLDPADIDSVMVALPPYGHRLVGHPFRIGDNPTVDAQFSAQFCVANVLLRGDSRIRHFSAESVSDPAVRRFLEVVEVAVDPGLDRRGHTAMDMRLRTRDGRVFEQGLDIAPGFPGNALTDEDHRRRFRDCMDYASAWFAEECGEAVQRFIERAESARDARELVALLAGPTGAAVVPR
jgi:2-methylcitrate dehydratase PrpD